MSSITDELAVQPSTKSGGWTKQPEEVRRRAILDAATGCFCAKGFANTSMQEIAVAAGLTKGGVYFHFGSKEAIRDALISEITDFARFGLDTAEVLALAPAARLQEQLTRLIAGMQIGEAGAVITIAEFVTRDKAGLEPAHAFFMQAAACLATTLADGQQQGVFCQEAEPALYAEWLLASINGLCLHHELDRAGINVCAGLDRVVALIVRTLRV